MTSISGLGLTTQLTATTAAERSQVVGRLGARAAGIESPASADRDVVEVSAEALLAAQQQAQPSERVARLKQLIAAGVYESDDKLTVVADRIAKALRA